MFEHLAEGHIGAVAYPIADRRQPWVDGDDAGLLLNFGKPFERLRFEPPRIAPAITKI
jgi:hypothetical protein